MTGPHILEKLHECRNERMRLRGKSTAAFVLGFVLWGTLEEYLEAGAERTARGACRARLQFSGMNVYCDDEQPDTVMALGFGP